MKLLHGTRAKRRRGFTLLEATVGASIFGIVGYGLVTAVGAGQASQESILENAISNKGLRNSALDLSSELRSCTASNFTVTRDAFNQSLVEFQMPITSGGNLDWGVYDKRLGTEWDEQNREDWYVRYTVEEDGDHDMFAGGETTAASTVTRRLVRQLVDDNDVVQFSETVVNGLTSGYGNHPGFSVVASGDMWNVTITLQGEDEDKAGNQVEFDVWMHN